MNYNESIVQNCFVQYKYSMIIIFLMNYFIGKLSWVVDDEEEPTLSNLQLRSFFSNIETMSFDTVLEWFV